VILLSTTVFPFFTSPPAIHDIYASRTDSFSLIFPPVACILTS
jgi:hypothetical protein